MARSTYRAGRTCQAKGGSNCPPRGADDGDGSGDDDDGSGDEMVTEPTLCRQRVATAIFANISICITTIATSTIATGRTVIKMRGIGHQEGCLGRGVSR